MEQEIWRDIPDYENYYQASNLGRIRTKERKIFNGKGYFIKKPIICKQRYNNKGYLQITLNKTTTHKKRNFLSHRLIALTFIDNPKNKPQVNHIDGNKTNNNINNLEWCSNRENQIHAIKNGLSVHSANSGRKKRKVDLFDKDGNFIKTFGSIKETVDFLDCAKGNVKLCCDGLRKTVKGYVVKYNEREVVYNGEF